MDPKYNRVCTFGFLQLLSKTFTELEVICVKYLFRLNFEERSKYVLVTLAGRERVTKAMVIEILYILNKWKQLEEFFGINVTDECQCALASGFNRIPSIR